MSIKAQTPPLCTLDFLVRDGQLVEVINISAATVDVADCKTGREFPIRIKDELGAWERVYPQK